MASYFYRTFPDIWTTLKPEIYVLRIPCTVHKKIRSFLLILEKKYYLLISVLLYDSWIDFPSDLGFESGPKTIDLSQRY